MSMTKRNFIALADMVRRELPTPDMFERNAIEYQWSRAQWAKMRDALADFCQSQNSRFNRERWLGYIAGECGLNGGEVRK